MSATLLVVLLSVLLPHWDPLARPSSGSSFLGSLPRFISVEKIFGRKKKRERERQNENINVERRRFHILSFFPSSFHPILPAGKVSWTWRLEVNRDRRGVPDCVSCASHWRIPANWWRGHSGGILGASPSACAILPGFDARRARSPAMCPAPDGPHWWAASGKSPGSRP